MSIERKCKNCEMFEQSTMEEKLGWCCDKQCDVLGNWECYDNCFRNEELVRQDERKKALFDIAMELEKDIPILESNYKYNNFGFQKGYWQGQLEYAYVLKNNLLDKANRKEL